MSRVNKMFEVPIPNTKNEEGFPAYSRSPEEQYLQMLLTNTLGSTFYATAGELLVGSNKIHEEMVAKDPEFAAKAIVYARKYGYMRTQPIFGLVKLSKVNLKLFKQAFSGVILTPADLQDFFVILKGEGRGHGGRGIKSAVAAWLNENLSEYWAIKYNGRGRGYSLSDIVRLVHPRSESKNALYRYLVHGEVDENLKQIAKFEELKVTQIPKEQVRLIQDGKLPHEVVTGSAKMTPELWSALVPVMPTFALLRNLATLDRAGVLDDHRDFITARLNDPEALKKSKILPFRFLNAYYALEEKPWVQDVLRQSVELTFENLPKIPGRTAIFLDISGSMYGGNFWGRDDDLGVAPIKTASVVAFALFKKTGGKGPLWLFNNHVYDAKPSLYDSILTQAEKIHPSGGTSSDAPFRALTDRNEKVDNIIMITDEQQNLGSPVYRELKSYKKKVNPNVNTFVIDISSYQGVTIPETAKNVWYIYGWSDQVLQFISSSLQGYGSMVDAIRSGESEG